MKNSIKQLMTAGLLIGIVSSLAPSAVLAYDRDQRALNQLMQQGLINPGQAAALANRQYGGFNGLQGFLGSNGNGYYSAGDVQRESREIDRLQRDGRISQGELNVLKAQLTQRVNFVNSNGAVGPSCAAQSAYPVSPYHTAGFQNQWHQGFNGASFQNPWHPGVNTAAYGLNNGFNGNVYGNLVNGNGFGTRVRNFLNY